jgi:hypothetical protein
MSEPGKDRRPSGRIGVNFQGLGRLTRIFGYSLGGGIDAIGDYRAGASGGGPIGVCLLVIATRD